MQTFIEFAKTARKSVKRNKMITKTRILKNASKKNMGKEKSPQSDDCLEHYSLGRIFVKRNESLKRYITTNYMKTKIDNSLENKKCLLSRKNRDFRGAD